VRILEQKASGIYVCLDGPGKDASTGKVQHVFLLKLEVLRAWVASRIRDLQASSMTPRPIS
jgi:hypothetical protein